MSGWRERVGNLLYAGESIEETVDFGEVSVVVTSHRVLALDPEGDGPTMQQADRPNVEGVTTGAQSNTGLLGRGVRYGVIGFVLVGAGMVVDFDGIVGGVDLGGESAQQVGLGGILGTLQRLLNLVSQLDQLMQVLGALALLLAAVLLGVYWLTRDPTLVVEVAGDDDIQLPRPADAAGVAERIERAITLDPTRRDHEGTPSRGPLGEA